MLEISTLLCGAPSPGGELRYGNRPGRAPSGAPVVVWNITRRCNLKCQHCYMSSQDIDYPGELSHAEGLAFLDDLASTGVPVVLFSGGEPLKRPDAPELIARCRQLGMRATLSTNGTLITPEMARRLKELDLSYVGISLDAADAAVHDEFRGVTGAFEATLQGIRNCQEAGLKVGLRFTVTALNVDELPRLFDIMDSAEIPRLCIYHLAYSGRGKKLAKEDLPPERIRQMMDYIAERTEDFQRRGLHREILTVDNHADGPYLYLRTLQRDPERAALMWDLLRRNTGNRSGVGIVAVDPTGDITPDQFWRNRVVGNIRQKPFSQWLRDADTPLLPQLRDRQSLLKGRCGTCRFLNVCNGNLRARAEYATGDPWESDPACYLTDEEIQPILEGVGSGD